MLEIRSAGMVDDWGLMRWADERGFPLPDAPPHAGTPVRLPPSPFGITYPVALEGVGRVYLWTNSFTTRTHTVLLERELTNRYLKAASGLIRQYARRGVPLEEPQAHVQQAQEQLSQEHWQEALAASVLAAEQGVVSLARARLQRMHGRTAFLWGVSTDEPLVAQQALAILAPPLNMIHLISSGAPDEWNLVLQQAQAKRIAIGAALTRPADASSFDTYEARLRAAITPARGQIRYWDVATDLQNQIAGEVLIGRLRALGELARTLDFGVVRLLHGRHSFTERQSPYPVLEACLEGGVPFEAVHLEWHWYEGTLYELDCLLESYGELGKPIHLQLALPPAQAYGVFSRVAPLEWVEGALLIALSKPYVVAVQIPARATEYSAGALEGDRPSAWWERLRRLWEWNRCLQGD